MDNSSPSCCNLCSFSFSLAPACWGCARGWQELLLEHPSGGSKDEVQHLGSIPKEFQSELGEGGLDGEPRWGWAGLEDLCGKTRILAASYQI